MVNILRQQHRTLDEAVHSLAKETANIKNIELKNQESISVLKDDVGTIRGDVGMLKGDVSTLKGNVGILKGDVNTLKNDMTVVKARLTALEHKVDERFDQMELLIRQLRPAN